MPDDNVENDEFTVDQTNRTWWERHAIPVMGLVSLVMLVFVIVFQTSC